MTDNTQEEIEAMDFETAFTALQANVSLLEGENLSLEQSLALFERGQALANRCAMLLEQAELKLRQISPDAPETLDTES